MKKNYLGFRNISFEKVHNDIRVFSYEDKVDIGAPKMITKFLTKEEAIKLYEFLKEQYEL